jgi:hypothetical protein
MLWLPQEGEIEAIFSHLGRQFKDALVPTGGRRIEYSQESM